MHVAFVVALGLVAFVVGYSRGRVMAELRAARAAHASTRIGIQADEPIAYAAAVQRPYPNIRVALNGYHPDVGRVAVTLVYDVVTDTVEIVHAP